MYMEHNLIQRLMNDFESVMHTTDDGVEFRLARELQALLGYTKWDNFLDVINKAKQACKHSWKAESDHFADVGKTITMPKGAEKEIPDIMPTILLKAKDFATEITIYNAKQNAMTTESQISEEHVSNNISVRKTLVSRGIVPEDVKSEPDIKKIERKLVSEDKKSLQDARKLKK